MKYNYASVNTGNLTQHWLTQLDELGAKGFRVITTFQWKGKPEETVFVLERVAPDDE
jgi:hypothetical protein